MNKTDKQKHYKKLATKYAKNITKYMQLATDSELNEGKNWYLDAYNFCLETASKSNLPLENVAGIVSALSPQTSWELNKKYTHAFIANKYVAKPKVTKAKAKVIHTELKSILDIYTILNGRKTQAFFMNIIKPLENTGFVTIDRHAVAICIQNPSKVSPLLDSEYTKYVCTELKYNCLADAYKIVAKKYELLPHEVQAITWVTYRRLRNINQTKYEVQVPF